MNSASESWGGHNKYCKWRQLVCLQTYFGGASGTSACTGGGYKDSCRRIFTTKKECNCRWTKDEKVALQIPENPIVEIPEHVASGIGGHCEVHTPFRQVDEITLAESHMFEQSELNHGDENTSTVFPHYDLLIQLFKKPRCYWSAGGPGCPLGSGGFNRPLIWWERSRTPL